MSVAVAPLPDAMAPPAGHYSYAIVSGGHLHVSGLLALDGTGALVGPGDAGAQARFIFAELERILLAAGTDLAHVVKLGLFLLDVGDRLAVNEARKAAFGEWKPASTLVGVAGLIGAGTLVEIEAIAAIPATEKDPA